MTLDGVFLIKKPQKFDTKNFQQVADPLKRGGTQTGGVKSRSQLCCLN